MAHMRGRFVRFAALALLAGCGGGGGGASTESPAGAGAGSREIVLTPVPGEGQGDLVAATKPLLKGKPTACAVAVLRAAKARDWVNISQTLLNADLSLKSVLALQTPQLRKSLAVGTKDLSGQRVPVQIVIIDKRVTELRIEGSDLRSSLEAAGVTMAGDLADQVGELSQAIEYAVKSGGVTVTAPRSVVASGACPAA